MGTEKETVVGSKIFICFLYVVHPYLTYVWRQKKVRHRSQTRSSFTAPTWLVAFYAQGIIVVIETKTL